MIFDQKKWKIIEHKVVKVDGKSARIIVLDLGIGNGAFFVHLDKNLILQIVCVPAQFRGRAWPVFKSKFMRDNPDTKLYLLTGDDPTQPIH